MSYKENLKKIFKESLDNYDNNAQMQMNISESLVDILPDLDQPKILEIGCGTGFLTEKILKKYPNGQFDITDLSPFMVEHCKKKFYDNNIRFFQMDGERIKMSNLSSREYRYDLIISSMVFHWFENPKEAIKNLKQFGPIFYATIGRYNFIEWQTLLRQLKLSKSIFPTPQVSGQLKEEFFSSNQINLFSFFKSLKDIGTGASAKSQARLSVSSCRKVMRNFNTREEKTMTWHIVYGAIK